MPTAAPQINTPADEPVDQAIFDNEAQSVGHLFRNRVAASPNGPAFMYANVKPEGDEWVTDTWAEVDVVVRELGAGLIALGVEPEDRVAIASSTRYEWALADLATMVAGGATTTIYPTTMADDVAFIASTYLVSAASRDLRYSISVRSTAVSRSWRAYMASRRAPGSDGSATGAGSGWGAGAGASSPSARAATA